MLDEEIIQMFFARSEGAINALEAKYGEICMRTSYNILGNYADAEECVNDSYLGVWNAIPPAKPDPLLTYVLKIVRNISLNRYHKNSAQKRNSYFDVAMEELEEVIESKNNIELAMESKELTVVIEAYLDTLTKENRVIFIRRYWFYDNYKQIAKAVGLSEKNVSVRLTRMRKEMQKYLQERGIFL